MSSVLKPLLLQSFRTGGCQARPDHEAASRQGGMRTA